MADSDPPLLDGDDKKEEGKWNRKKPTGMSALLAASAFKAAGKEKKTKEVSISERRLSIENVTLAAGAAKRIHKRKEEGKESKPGDNSGIKGMMAKMVKSTDADEPAEVLEKPEDEKKGIKGMMASLAAGKAEEPQGGEKESSDEKKGIKGMMASLAAANAKAQPDEDIVGKAPEKAATTLSAEAGSSMDVSSEGEAITGEESSGEVKKEHSVLLNLIKKKRARKLEEKAKEEAAIKDKDASNKPPSEAENPESKKNGSKRGRMQGTKKKVGPSKKGEKRKGQAGFEVGSLFGPEVKPPVKRQGYSPSSARASSEPRKRGPGRAVLRRQTSSSALSGNSTDETDLTRTNSSSEGGIKAVLDKADKKKEEVKAGGRMPSDVRDMLIVPGSQARLSPRRKPTSPRKSPILSLKKPSTPIKETRSSSAKESKKTLPAPSVKEKFEEEAKRQAVANYLASPLRMGMVDKALSSITPSKPPEDTEPGSPWGAKLKLTDVIIAASAAKAVKMKSKEEVPPPTLEEQAERQCRRLLILCQKGEWDSAGETLKALDVMVAQETMDRKILTETADRVTGNTPIMYAAIENKISFMERMLSLGCNVNKKNNENYTALHFAAMYSREDTVNWLLAKRANPNLKGGPMQQTCVHLACARHSGQSAQIVKILLHHSNKDVRFVGDLADSLPLFTAIEAGNSNVCRELLSVDPGRQLSQTKQPLNDTAMHLAARRKDANLAKVLIEAGAQVDMQNKEGQTVLHLASIMGDDNMVRVLFMARANANLQDNEDRAPIHLAAERGYSSIVEFLVEKFKASIYERTRDGSTLMHIAAVNGHPDTAMILFERGVPLLMPNKFGARGIHTAAREGHVSVIDKLIKNGEAVDSKTGDGKTALLLAVEVKHLYLC